MITNDGKRLWDGSTSSRRTLLLGALAALAVGCSAGGDGAAPDAAATTGEVGVNLRLSDGVSIRFVSYDITGGPTHLTGTIDVGASATISATLGPLLVGSNYALSMTATTSAGSRCTGAAGPFAVSANQATPVSVVLTCPSLHETGTVAVSGTMSACPRIAAVTAAPSEVYVGNDIRLRAVAGPDDAAHGYPLTYAWGGVSSSDAGNALFHCTTPGSYTIALTVDNGNAACTTTPPDPAMSSSVTVTCTEEGGGGSVQ